MTGKELKELRIAKGISQQQLADKTGVPQGTIGRIESTGEEIKKASTIRVMNDFFNNEFGNLLNEPEMKYGLSKTVGGVPVYYHDISTGLFDNKNIKPVGWLNVQEFSGCDAIIRVKDDSMAGRMNERDWIGIKKVNEWAQYLPMGYIYAISTGDIEIIRTIKKGKSDDVFKMISSNKAYEDDEIPKSVIKEVWSVKTILPYSKIETLL